MPARNVKGSKELAPEDRGQFLSIRGWFWRAPYPLWSPDLSDFLGGLGGRDGGFGGSFRGSTLGFGSGRGSTFGCGLGIGSVEGRVEGVPGCITGRPGVPDGLATSVLGLVVG